MRDAAATTLKFFLFDACQWSGPHSLCRSFYENRVWPEAARVITLCTCRCHGNDGLRIVACV